MTDALSQNDGESPALSSQLDQALQQANQSLNSIEQAKADAMELVQGIKTTAENVASNDRDIGTLLASVKKQAEDIEAVHTNASDLLEGIKKSASNVDSALEAAQAALVAAQEANANAQAQLKECISAKEEADAAAALLKGLSDKAQTVEKRIADYETRLDELAQQSKQQLEVITGLLPGATRAAWGRIKPC
jgi:chromosome segregation ATPase